MGEIITEPEVASQLDVHEQSLEAVRALPLDVQLERLDIHYFKHHEFIATEVMVTLFRDARVDGKEHLAKEYALKLSDRITHLAWHKLFPLTQKGLVKDLDSDSEDLAMDVLCAILKELDKPENSYVLRRFGQFFDRRFIDYIRHLNTDKRKMVLSYSEVLPVNEDGEQIPPEEHLSELADDSENICDEAAHVETLQYYQSILTENEFRVYYYHYELHIPIESIKDDSPSISKMMGKTARTIQTYKKSALEKIKGDSK